MVMPTRFAYLRDIRSTNVTPRQPIPERFRAKHASDSEYLAWLVCEIRQVQEQFSKEIQGAVSKLNRAIWPSDVGLSSEQFPYKIWRGEARSKLHEDEGLYMGEILTQRARVTSAEVSAMELKERAAAKVRSLRARILRKAATQHVFVTGMERDVIEVQASGKLDRQVVDPANLRASRGAGVLIPGPLKREQRCRDKIITDYEGKDAWPPAASLVDIVRCCIAFDDPYAMAVMVALLQKEFDVLRVKNRFENDEVVEASPERIQAEFYAAETSGTDSTNESATNSEKMYRDVNLNLRPKGSEFVVEVQLTLTGISILKKSEQKIYTLARMASAEELVDISVFSEQRNVSVRSMAPTSHILQDRYNSESGFETDLGGVTIEIEKEQTADNQMESLREVPLFSFSPHQEPEILQTDAPVGFGFMQGMFSCGCEPCGSASGDRVLASAPAPSALSRSQVPFVDSDLAATSAKLDVATARIASLEAEIASLRASKETMRQTMMQALQSA